MNKETYEEQLNKIYEIYEDLKPLNFGRRLYFQRYCYDLVYEGKIHSRHIEDFLSQKFLFDVSPEEEDEEDDEDDEKSKYEKSKYENEKTDKFLSNLVKITFNIVTLYVGYKIVKKFHFKQ